MSTLRDRFLAALKFLQDWYTDSLKARDYNSPATSSSKPGSTHFRSQSYPSTRQWLEDWRRARDAADQERLVEAIEAEIDQLSGSPRTEAYRDHWNKTRYRTVTS